MAIPSKYKIISVKTFSENLDLTRPYTIAFKTFTSVENIFVKIETGAGLVGIGAGSPASFVMKETMESAKEKLTVLEAFLLGADLRKMNGIIRRLKDLFPTNPSVRAAVDIALYDVYAKTLGIPLVDLWGRAHLSLPTSVTIGISSMEESVAQAKEYLGLGFKIIKLKTGKTVAEDVAVFSKIKETVGNKMRIRVDANQGYSVQDTKDFYRLTKKLKVELIEQPIPTHQVKEMKKLAPSVRKICMADESLKSAVHALDLAQKPHLFGLYNIKLMKCGGISEAMEIAKIAELADISLMWGCMDESIISITAALHAAMACPNTKYLDLDGSLDLAKDVVSGGFILEDGYMRIGEKNGLGVELL